MAYTCRAKSSRSGSGACGGSGVAAGSPAADGTGWLRVSSASCTPCGALVARGVGAAGKLASRAAGTLPVLVVDKAASRALPVRATGATVAAVPGGCAANNATWVGSGSHGAGRLPQVGSPGAPGVRLGA